jgi:acetate kinase
MKILVLNAGSSTQKSCLYDLRADALSDHPPPLWDGFIDWTHQAGIAEIKVKTAHGSILKTTIPATNRAEATATLLKTLWHGDTQVIDRPEDIDMVGHRIVHGGQQYQKPTIVTPEVKAAIAKLSTLAPVHNPVNLEGIEAIEQILGTVPQVAVFDTAFHSQMPLAAAIYPIPYEWFEHGIRRYGFHGISHQYVANRAAQILGQDLASLKLITCHLGNGCSLAAIQQGQSVDTTMGFTPLEGLMMGSRSGSIDPGILLHWMRQYHLDADQLDDLLNRQSGLKGISGISGDMRQILAAIDRGNDRARLAFQTYIHRLRSLIGSMLASLGGLDALVFTGGVGENAAAVRAAVCEGFGFIQLELDLEKNSQTPVDQDVASIHSQVRVVVVHTEEDWAIAQECWRMATKTS